MISFNGKIRKNIHYEIKKPINLSQPADADASNQSIDDAQNISKEFDINFKMKFLVTVFPFIPLVLFICG